MLYKVRELKWNDFGPEGQIFSRSEFSKVVYYGINQFNDTTFYGFVRFDGETKNLGVFSSMDEAKKIISNIHKDMLLKEFIEEV